MRCSRCSGPIGKVVQWFQRSHPTDHEAHAVAVAAAAVAVTAHEVDCPLGVMVLDEVSRAPAGEPVAGLRRAAERMLSGKAKVLRDGVLLNAALTCCADWRDRHACPLSSWFARDRTGQGHPQGGISASRPPGP